MINAVTENELESFESIITFYIILQKIHILNHIKIDD